jgi:hypothetical protein
MGFDPHFLYNREASALVEISGEAENRGDSQADSSGSVNSSVESWDNHHDKDSIGQ